MFCLATYREGSNIISYCYYCHNNQSDGALTVSLSSPLSLSLFLSLLLFSSVTLPVPLSSPLLLCCSPWFSLFSSVALPVPLSSPLSLSLFLSLLLFSSVALPVSLSSPLLLSLFSLLSTGRGRRSPTTRFLFLSSFTGRSLSVGAAGVSLSSPLILCRSPSFSLFSSVALPVSLSSPLSLSLFLSSLHRARQTFSHQSVSVEVFLSSFTGPSLSVGAAGVSLSSPLLLSLFSLFSSVALPVSLSSPLSLSLFLSLLLCRSPCFSLFSLILCRSPCFSLFSSVALPVSLSSPLSLSLFLSLLLFSSVALPVSLFSSVALPVSLFSPPGEADVLPPVGFCWGVPLLFHWSLAQCGSCRGFSLRYCVRLGPHSVKPIVSQCVWQRWEWIQVKVPIEVLLKNKKKVLIKGERCGGQLDEWMEWMDGFVSECVSDR